jgi:hypothetical protein
MNNPRLRLPMGYVRELASFSAFIGGWKIPEYGCV